ncbi:hypothetical protein [Pelosinus sp. IPA-1]|uniref:hypothetical protein n=1 Tax=Pelosinus sp. IPA-1 TaxID=3029569 RepID=UPI00243623E4|nr:hypothetical protein [Pelosinus sp. IPA-1]GMB00006.1 hypothetical protein PIPA1_28050 [Pelosinus sp. IPA-1]
MKIFIDRDSVCMGDDVEEHAFDIEVDDDFDFTELFRYIININYFPEISGNDVIWTMEYGKGTEIATYQTVNNKIYTTFVGEIPLVKKWVDYSNERFLFKYYSSREKRAKCIFVKCAGDGFHIWHEGYLSEYESYDITKEMEQKWRVEL